jgi:hypothetical protein
MTIGLKLDQVAGRIGNHQLNLLYGLSDVGRRRPLNDGGCGRKLARCLFPVFPTKRCPEVPRARHGPQDILTVLLEGNLRTKEKEIGEVTRTPADPRSKSVRIEAYCFIKVVNGKRQVHYGLHRSTMIHPEHNRRETLVTGPLDPDRINLGVKSR